MQAVYPLLLPITLVLFGLRTIRNLLYQLFMWQIRDSRADRMLVQLKTSTGIKWMFGPIAVLKWILLLVYLWVPQIRSEIWPLTILYVLEVGLLFREVFKPKYPTFTLKLMLISVMSIAALSSLVFAKDLLPIPVLILIADKVLPVIVAGLMLGMRIPFLIYKRIQIRKATSKLSQFPNLKRIGITGSVGKSSTKEYLAQILSEKYTVVKTQKNINTDIGAAQLILKDVNQSSQVLLVEMGAYRVGEIKIIADMVKPDIAIVTAISEQHLELFGSIANIRSTKYELVESLTQKGSAILNADNQYTRLMAHHAKHTNVLLYGTHKDARYRISQIDANPQGTSFVLKFNAQEMNIKTPLLGTHQVYALTAAMVAASIIGMKAAEIVAAIEKIQPAHSIMEPVVSTAAAKIINDTGNASFESVRAAISYLQLFSGKKYLVLTPLIEHGNKNETLHEQIGVLAAQNNVEILVTNTQNLKALKKGAAKHHGQITLVSAKKVQEIIRNSNSRDALVFEGKEAAKYLKIV